jgi:predicted PurR-regulated permease PerM
MSKERSVHGVPVAPSGRALGEESARAAAPPDSEATAGRTFAGDVGRNIGLRAVSMRSGFWWRAALIGGLAIFLGLGALAGIHALGHPFAVVVLAFTVASALAPLVDFLDRWLPRVVAVIIVYLLLPGIPALVGYFTVPSLVNQLESVTSNLPNLIGQLQPLLNRLGNLAPGDLVNTITSHLSQFASTLVSVPLMIVNSIVDIVAIIFISIYALLSVADARRFVLSLVPEEQKEGLHDLLHEIVREMGGYLRGAFLDGVIIGISTYIGLLIIGVDFPLILSFFAGLMEIIPAVGPIVAAVPILLVSLLQSPTTALFSLIFMLGIHQFEGNIVFPNVMRSQTSISPMLVLVALLSGYAGGGLIGAVVAIPLVAVARVLVIQVLAPAVRRQTGAPEPEREEETGTKSRKRKQEETAEDAEKARDTEDAAGKKAEEERGARDGAGHQEG